MGSQSTTIIVVALSAGALLIAYTIFSKPRTVYREPEYRNIAAGASFLKGMGLDLW